MFDFANDFFTRSNETLITMKLSYRNLFAMGALLSAAVAAQAQLYIATGGSGVTTSFNFSFDTALNRVTVQVDNTAAGVGGVTGTVTSFGFNIPNALAGTGSLLSYSGTPALGAWAYFEPYNLNAGGNVFQQEVGAGTGANPNGGHPPHSIPFGGTATFVFQFGDFSDASGFLGVNGVTARWQQLSVPPGSDEGFGNTGTPGGGPVLTPVPEPSTYGMIGAAGLLAAAILRRKFNSRSKK